MRWMGDILFVSARDEKTAAEMEDASLLFAFQ
jgi:hypothetical protein